LAKVVENHHIVANHDIVLASMVSDGVKDYAAWSSIRHCMGNSYIRWVGNSERQP